jgi:predicted cupin superfamily sugar epimerase
VTAAQGHCRAWFGAPSPEGGRSREIWRDAPEGGGRGAGTAIYFLLAADEFSHAGIASDAAEAWRRHAGWLRLSLSPMAMVREAVHLGPELSRHQRPFALVPRGWWQSAVSLGRWTLVGSTVSPGL